MVKVKAENKRKAKLTLAKYRSSKTKKAKTVQSQKSKKSASTSSQQNSSSTNGCNKPSSSYHITDKGDGMDLSTFRFGSIQNFKAPKTISSSLSNTLNSKFLYPQSKKQHNLPITTIQICY